MVDLMLRLGLFAWCSDWFDLLDIFVDDVESHALGGYRKVAAVEAMTMASANMGVGNGGEAPFIGAGADDVPLPAAVPPPAGPRPPMRWTPANSGFVLRRICELVAKGARTDKGFKECHVNQVAKNLKEFSGEDVTSTQVEPADGSKATDAPTTGTKRKRAFSEEEALLMTNMTDAVNNVAAALRETGPAHVDDALYDAVMLAPGFTEEALMVVFSHLLDNKAQGRGYIKMNDEHRLMDSYYVVFVGKVPGVYSSWEDCQRQKCCCLGR
ncbi:hypothetical protein EJB05_18195, partial [Eragrostis curvula]